MTSSKIEMPGEVKADPAALMASLHLLPSPTPNLEIKYTKVSGRRAPVVHGDFLEPSFLSPISSADEGGVTGTGGPGSPGPACHPCSAEGPPACLRDLGV